MTNDNDVPSAGSMSAMPDPHGQAALVLVESLLHGLLSSSVLTLSQAAGILDTALSVQVDIADAADGNAEAMWRAHAILTTIIASLKRDMDIL